MELTLHLLNYRDGIASPREILCNAHKQKVHFIHPLCIAVEVALHFFKSSSTASFVCKVFKARLLSELHAANLFYFILRSTILYPEFHVGYRN